MYRTLEMPEQTYTLLIIGAAFLMMVPVFLIGKKSGDYLERIRRLEENRVFEKKIADVESGRNELLREIEDLGRLNEKYLFFVLRIPEAVKNLNSNLTFDETVSSIIRFSKDIIDTDCIELYLFNEESWRLAIEAAFGSNRKNKIEVPYGEGVIGKAAEQRVIISRANMPSLPKETGDMIFYGAPVMFRNTLIGVLGFGKIKNATGNEKRFIAMIADLAGVSLQNCERLSTAQHQANTDALTGLYNKKYFAERSLLEAERAIIDNSPISLFMFDIDHFKKYNDNNGHAEGDYLLSELGLLLKENTRGRDIIARYGGEEFIVMLPNTDKKGAYLYAEKIRGLIASTAFRHREKQPLGLISISGGIATFPSDSDTIDATVKLADIALYKSKEAGRNRVMCYEPTGLG